MLLFLIVYRDRFENGGKKCCVLLCSIVLHSSLTAYVVYAAFTVTSITRIVLHVVFALQVYRIGSSFICSCICTSCTGSYALSHSTLTGPGGGDVRRADLPRRVQYSCSECRKCRGGITREKNIKIGRIAKTPAGVTFRGMGSRMHGGDMQSRVPRQRRGYTVIGNTRNAW
jgi:hypothetical protein